MSMESEGQHTERVDVYIPDWMDSAIEEQLGYGDSKSGWVREATRQRLIRETNDEFDN